MPRSLLYSGLLISLLLVLLQQLQPQLRFEHTLISQGQLWRLLTGHLVHTNTHHLGMNLLGFWVYLVLCQSVVSWRTLAVGVPVLALGISLLLYTLNPQLHWYVGFSGVLHGLLLWGGVRLLQSNQDRFTGAAIVLLLILKTAYDSWVGGNPASSALIEAPVVIAAHQYGLLCGLILAYSEYYRSRQRARPVS